MQINVNSIDLSEYSNCFCCLSIPNWWKKWRKNKWIKKDVNLINEKFQGKRNLELQLTKQRIELICFGALWNNHPEILNEWNILNRDTKLLIPNYEKTVKPDLILMQKNFVFHVEIDENNHSGYDKNDEKNRLEAIKNHFKNHDYKYVSFVPDLQNKYESGKFFSEEIPSILYEFTHTYKL